MSLLISLVAVGISAAVILWTLSRILVGRFNPLEDLPFGLCNLTALIAPAQAFTQAPLLTAWAVCLGGPGGLISLLTPDLEPHHDRATRLKFWIVHVGLVAHALLCAILFAPRGGARMIGAVALTATAFVFATIILNWLLNANYMFLRHKPNTASLLDWFGPWPHYLLSMYVAGFAVVVLAFLGWSAIWR